MSYHKIIRIRGGSILVVFMGSRRIYIRDENIYILKSQFSYLNWKPTYPLSYIRIRKNPTVHENWLPRISHEDSTVFKILRHIWCVIRRPSSLHLWSNVLRMWSYKRVYRSWAALSRLFFKNKTPMITMITTTTTPPIEMPAYTYVMSLLLASGGVYLSEKCQAEYKMVIISKCQNRYVWSFDLIN